MSVLTPLLDACAPPLAATGEPMAMRFAARLAEERESLIATAPTGFPLGAFPDLDAVTAESTRRAVDHLRAEAEAITWFQSSTARVPPGWSHRSAACELLAPGGMIEVDDIRFGAFYLSPGLDYPDHWHEAEEFYCVLAGSAEWTIDGQGSRTRRPGELVRTPSMARHAIVTGTDPLLALWGWSGNIDYGTYAY